MRPQPLRKREPERVRGTVDKFKAFSEVVPAWKGQTVVCIAGGPSLTQEQVDKARDAGAAAIAINDAYLLAPWADVCFFADYEWWQWHSIRHDARVEASLSRMGLTPDEVRERFKAFAGQKCSLSSSGDGIYDEAVHILKNAGDWGVSLQPTHLFSGRHSGFCAVNLAILAGAKKIVLLGYDARAPMGRPSHWFGEHPRRTNVTVYNKFVESFERTRAAIAAAGVRVINATPCSRIPTFEFMSIDSALKP